MAFSNIAQRITEITFINITIVARILIYYLGINSNILLFNINKKSKKNQIMKNINLLLIVSIVCLFFISGCTSSNSSTGASLNGKWLLKTLNGEEVVKEKTGGEMLYLDFNVKGNSVGGNTGCNNLGGKIIVTAAEITFSDMWMTKMACDAAEYEIDFTSLLFSSEPLKYKIDNDVLTFFKSEKVIMTFERVK